MIIEPLRTFFGFPNRYLLSVRPSGYGHTEEEAWQAFNHVTLATAEAIRRLRDSYRLSD